MKFTDGYWMTREGVTLYSPMVVQDITKEVIQNYTEILELRSLALYFVYHRLQ